MQITVVIPTYNEAENLPKLVSALLALPFEDLRLLVVDDNSPDGTGQLADELAISQGGRVSVLHRPEKKGLGMAYIAGFIWALQQGAQVIGQMDADFSHPPEKLLDLHAALHMADVAVGSRYVPGGGVDHRWPLWRKGLSYFGSLYARLILSLPLRDVTGGFKLWPSRVLQQMPLERIRSNGYAFQIEMAYVAHRLGFTFQEVPFYFTDRRWGQSKMSFDIQKEAALRVWQMLLEYRGLRPKE